MCVREREYRLNAITVNVKSDLETAQEKLGREAAWNLPDRFSQDVYYTMNTFMLSLINMFFVDETY